MKICVKTLSLVGLVVLCAAFCCAGADPSGLDEAVIERIRSDFRMDSHTRAMYNAISNTDIRTLAVNRDLLREHDEFFSSKVEVKGISNQRSSGRCWLFAALNSIRQHVIKENKLKNFDFSHIYLTFWDKMEKANTFYERMIEFRDRDMMDRELVFLLKKPLPDGGYWENAKDLIQKYGLVPKEVMPETHSSNNTAMMNHIIERKMRVDAVKLRKMAGQQKSVRQMRRVKEEMLGEVYRLLVMNLGVPPVEFDWRYEPKEKGDDEDSEDGDEGDDDGDEQSDDEEDDDYDDGEDADDDEGDDDDGDVEDEDEGYEDKSVMIKGYTPKRFYDEFVGVDLDEYVNILNDTTHPVGRRYQIVLTRNLYDGRDLDYANVDIETIKAAATKSLADGRPLWFACDVSVDQYSDKGIMAENMYDYGSIFDVDLEMFRAELALFRENVPNHGMNLVGVDIQDGRAVKWLVENSWGSDKGSSGMWVMYDDWFDMNVYGIVVRKEYLPEEIVEIFEQTPTKLPVWDPMW